MLESPIFILFAGLASVILSLAAIGMGLKWLIRSLRTDEELSDQKKIQNIEHRLERHDDQIRSLENRHSELDNKTADAIRDMRKEVSDRFDQLFNLIQGLILKK